MIEIGRSGCAPAQRRRKAAGGALLILMAGLTGCAPKLAPKAPPPLVTVAQPITRRIIDWDDYVGQFVAPESVEVRPRVAGYIQSIAFKDGAEVRKGDLLFVIDPRPYKAVLDQAKAQQQHAQAAVQGAEIEERRPEGLVEAKALSDQDLQTPICRLAATPNRATSPVARRISCSRLTTSRCARERWARRRISRSKPKSSCWTRRARRFRPSTLNAPLRSTN